MLMRFVLQSCAAIIVHQMKERNVPICETVKEEELILDAIGDNRNRGRLSLGPWMF